MHGRGKFHTLRIIVLFKKKNNAGAYSAKARKAKATAGDLNFNAKAPGTSPANLAAGTSRYITQLEYGPGPDKSP